MGDKVYYRVQYPLKNGVELLKEIDREIEEGEEEILHEKVASLSEYEKSRLKNFIKKWEEDGRANLVEFINELRQTC